MKPTIQIIIGILAALVLSELVLQAVDRNTYSQFVNDPHTGLLKYPPDASLTVSKSCYENVIHTNHLGLYAPDVPAEKRPNVFRIAVIGSSFVEAVQVPLEQNFTHLLEQQLNASSTGQKYEVIPFAFSGNGTYLDLLYFINDALSYQPDLVIDLSTDYFLDKNAETATYPPRFDALGDLVLSLPQAARSDAVVQAKNILRRSKLAMNIAKKLLIAKNAFVVPEPGAETSATTTQASPRLWDIEDKILQSFQKISAEHEARFMLASWVSDPQDMTAHTDFGAGLSVLSKKRGFPYLDLQPILLERERVEQVQPIIPCDAHWNQTGHRWAAEELYAFLQKHPELLHKP